MNSKRSRAATCLAAASLACALAGCGSRDDYPKDWPAIETSWFRSCPDLAGTYTLGHGAPPFFRASYGGRPPWERLVIDGRPGGDLRLTLTRTVKPAVDPMPWSPVHDAREQAEADLRAQAMARAAKAARPVPTETVQVLPRGGYSCSRGRLTLRGGYVLALDKSHGLVGQGQHVQATKQVDVWCGDGCKGIPYGFEVQHLRQRWDWLGATPSVALAGGTAH